MLTFHRIQCAFQVHFKKLGADCYIQTCQGFERTQYSPSHFLVCLHLSETESCNKSGPDYQITFPSTYRFADFGANAPTAPQVCGFCSYRLKWFANDGRSAEVQKPSLALSRRNESLTGFICFKIFASTLVDSFSLCYWPKTHYSINPCRREKVCSSEQMLAIKNQ